MKRQLLKLSSVILTLSGIITMSSCRPALRQPAESSATTTAQNAIKSSKTNNSSVSSVPGKTGSTSSNESQSSTIITKDRKDLQDHSGPGVYNPEGFENAALDGSWSIERVYDKQAIGEIPPYIRFDSKGGRIYGNNGCNTVNGDYECNPENHTLEFSNLLNTMRLCATQGITDKEITKALTDTRTYSLTENREGYVMTFYDSKGQKIMELSHQNLHFLNGTWKVVEIEDEPVNMDGLKLVFDVDMEKIHGNTGCNVLNGKLVTDPEKPNTFSFENIAVTLMYCEEMEYQTAMLGALEEACRARRIDKDKLQLLNSAGKSVMTLQQTTDR